MARFASGVFFSTSPLRCGRVVRNVARCIRNNQQQKIAGVFQLVHINSGYPEQQAATLTARPSGPMTKERKMRECQPTDNFMPSEIARLVLGYLKETNCANTWEMFLSESPHLHEYKQLFNEGKEYPTNFNGKSLLDILHYYYTASLKDSTAASEMKSIIERLENSISQLRNYTSESLHPRTAKQLSIGCISRQTTLQCVRTLSNIAATSSQRSQPNRNEIRNNNILSLNSCSDRNIRVETQMEVEQTSPNIWNDSNSQISRITPVSSSSFINENPTVQSNEYHSSNPVGFVNSCLNKETELERAKSDHMKNVSKQNYVNVNSSVSLSNNISQASSSVRLEPEITEHCTELSLFDKRSCNNFAKQYPCSSSHSAQSCHHTTTQLISSSSKEPMSICENENVFVTQCHQQTCSCVLSTGISHNCNFSTCISSASANNKASNQYSTSNNLSSLTVHNRNTPTLPSVSNNTSVLSRNSIEFSCPLQNERTNISLGNNNESINITSTNNFDCIARVNLSSAINQEVRSCAVGHFNFPISTSTMEHSPSSLFSQQRNLLPSLTTPVKDLMEYEDYFRSPKRKSLLPRRRLLSSFSPTVCPNSENESNRKDTGIVSEEITHPEEEIIDYGGILMEELINFHPLFEKIAENINKVVSNNHNQPIDTTKAMTDSEASLSSQESHVPEALIKDILNRTESDPVFEEVLTFLCEKVDSSRDSFENENISQANDVQESIQSGNKELPKQNLPFNSSEILNDTSTTLKENDDVSVAQSFQDINKQCLNKENNNTQNCNNERPSTSETSNTLQNPSIAVCSELPNVESEVNLNTNVSLPATVDSNVRILENGLNTNVTLASNFVVQPTAVTPIKINVPDFQFLTVSPSHLFGMQTLLSFEPKRTPKRVQPIQPKLTDGSSLLSNANSTCVLQHNKQRTPNGKRPKRQRCLKSKLQKISENTSINQLKANKPCNKLPSNPLQSKLPQENSQLHSPPRNANNKPEQMDKTSPQLKSLVTSAQALAGRSCRTPKAHVRVLDFGPEANAANSKTSYVNNIKQNNLIAQVDLPSEIVLGNENQVSEDKQEIHLGYLNETGELVIYLNDPEALNESVVTVPYNSEITIPAIVTYTSANQASEVAIVENTENANAANDSEIAETLVSLASSGRNASKPTRSKQNKTTGQSSAKRNFQAILPKKPQNLSKTC
ncbi:protein NPAT-like isoform X2 [Centruroides sculpturatus]|uniref:protein NPAT-like isoform X2 n=1 Tax=Centruroides sculpturatus TaxID=218467 RepID=UPI000C6DCD00|nr:protein NPAT-like isoform X2 [Centruroides sculpturatus]